VRQDFACEVQQDFACEVQQDFVPQVQVKPSMLVALWGSYFIFGPLLTLTLESDTISGWMRGVSTI